MTETEIDFSTIAHLDFEPENDKFIPCQGTKFSDPKTGEEFNTLGGKCGKRAVLAVFHACCGQMKYMCQDCYNMESLAVSKHTQIQHSVSKGISHIATKPFYSRVEFL